VSNESDGRTPPEGSSIVAATAETTLRRPATLDEAFESASKVLHGLSMHYATGLDGPAVKLLEVETIFRELESDVRRLVLAAQEQEQ
jgi:hypothetical protein